MLYHLTHSVDANTTEVAPDWQKLDVSKGTIVQWVLFMPEEAANLLHVRVEYHNSQLLPFKGKSWIHGWFTPFPVMEKMKIDGAPYVLDVFAYNEDDSYSHEYNLFVNIEPEQAVIAGGVSSDVVSWWRGLFGGGV